MRYPDAANPDLLAKVPLDAQTIFDVGCGSAATGLEYKRRNPASRYFAIEADPEAAAVAAGRLDHVITGDIEENPLPFGAQRFDCIIYGDVLEHLRDPWAVMRQHVALLNPNGVVLICMPNLEHWSFAAALLRGGWDYEDMGLMDRTHLRWFTYDSTQRAIEAAGLRPMDVSSRIFDGPAAEQFVQALAPGLVAMGVDPAAYLRRAAPLQYIWRATPAPVARLNVISTMLEPVGGVSQLRVVDPIAALATLPGLYSAVAHSNELPPLEPDSPKIFIFHRPLLLGEAGLLPIRQLLALNYIVICEFDDHPDYIPVLQRHDVQNFRAVHAIQTSTLPLAEVLSRENPNVAVFPNAVPRLPEPRNFADPHRLTLFFGGLNREEDWPEFIPALNAVAAIAGERLHFRIVNDQGLFDALDTPHKSFTPLCDHHTYLELLGGCEFSFMPLQDTPFNRCKSDLKYLEASAHRVVSVASPTVYGEIIEDGKTGVVFTSADMLQQRLLELIADPDSARAMADAARAQVARERMIAYQTAARADWYRGLWARRAELQADLLARVPELADAIPVENEVATPEPVTGEG